MAIPRKRFNEGGTGFVTAQVVDDDGAVVSESAITAATLTLFDLQTYVPSASPAVGIINGRDAQDINAAGQSPASLNNVTYLDNGYFRWDLQPEDNIIVTPRRQIERHRAEFNFQFDSGSFFYAVELEVINIRSAV